MWAAHIEPEFAEQLFRVNPVLREQVAVLLVVDLVWQLLLGLVGLVVLAALAQELDDLAN